MTRRRGKEVLLPVQTEGSCFVRWKTPFQKEKRRGSEVLLPVQNEGSCFVQWTAPSSEENRPEEPDRSASRSNRRLPPS